VVRVDTSRVIATVHDIEIRIIAMHHCEGDTMGR
jgi:hypothetical protein